MNTEKFIEGTELVYFANLGDDAGQKCIYAGEGLSPYTSKIILMPERKIIEVYDCALEKFKNSRELIDELVEKVLKNLTRWENKDEGYVCNYCKQSHGIECMLGHDPDCIVTLIEKMYKQIDNEQVEIPKEETVQQWEKRTGETYPDDGPVWLKSGTLYYDPRKKAWELMRHERAKTMDYTPIIVATHHERPESV